MRRILFLLCSALVAGCAALPQPRTVTFTCDRGEALSVQFFEDLAVVRTSGGRVHRLPQEPVASGYLYRNAVYSLRGKGREALWSVGRMAPETCMES